MLAGLALVPGPRSALAAGGATRDEVYPVPPSGVFTVHGRGFGHGRGMSQWGAYGAAKQDGLSANQILHFYYPHTTLATRSTTRTIRVLLSAADAPRRGYVHVNPAAGLTVTPADGAALTLPTETAKQQTITGWRLQRNAAVVNLREQVGGSWHTKAAVGTGATFSAAGAIPVVEPGRVVSYWGAVTGEIESGAMEAVNVVNIELYLRSVVPSEMSPSWPAAALAAQAIAARTYATRERDHPKASWFDLYGDTRDQAYGGLAVESASTTKAIEATAGEVIVDTSGRAILAQYASADGGWTVSGGVSYLPAKPDPYDGAIANTAHAWTASVSARTLESAYPQLGTLKDLEIIGRDGNGLWGGRVTSVTLVGTKSSANVSGPDLQSAIGLRSYWFRPEPLPAAPAGFKATVSGRTVTATWKPPASVKGAAAVTGYRLTLSPGGYRQKLASSARTASVSKLPAGTYTVAIVALSDAGPGPPASVVVKTVHK
jgi:stage II sporulation protein D